jgi:hypothetical protein
VSLAVCPILLKPLSSHGNLIISSPSLAPKLWEVEVPIVQHCHCSLHCTVCHSGPCAHHKHISSLGYKLHEQFELLFFVRMHNTKILTKIALNLRYTFCLVHLLCLMMVTKTNIGLLEWGNKILFKQIKVNIAQLHHFNMGTTFFSNTILYPLPNNIVYVRHSTSPRRGEGRANVGP